MTTLSVKIDDNDKKDFEMICKQIGLNLSSAINVFIKATIYSKGIPFSLKLPEEDPYIYSEENMKYLRQSIAEAKAGKVFEHEIKDFHQ